ncbi:hypothetical protein [Streptomyces sp. NPDC058613]|uniref:hypothetical protein n=1 Tax=Streptomyces sp. NPDC058613 TaxID=3346556 RepID=UPI0036681E72
MVEVGAADAEACGRLVRAQGHVVVQERGQGSAAGQRLHLIREDLRKLGVAAEAEQKDGAHKVADRGRGHPRPPPRERNAERFHQPVRGPPHADRATQRGAYRLRVGRLHHRPRPLPRARVGRRHQAGAGRPPPRRHGTRRRPAAWPSSYASR